ncbi:unnamed protein product, partial [Owenia fusiformis]
RLCNSPEPQYGGSQCITVEGVEQLEESQVETCNTQPCPIDGGWGNWTVFEDCSQTCNGGIQSRSRACNNPSPEFGGKMCVDSEGVPTLDESETRICNTQLCPINGGWGDWSVGSCTVSCGGGTSTSVRYCDKPKPAFGGEDCLSLDGTRLSEETNTIPCNEFRCPQLATTEKPVDTTGPNDVTEIPLPPGYQDDPDAQILPPLPGDELGDDPGSVVDIPPRERQASEPLSDSVAPVDLPRRRRPVAEPLSDKGARLDGGLGDDDALNEPVQASEGDTNLLQKDVVYGDPHIAETVIGGTETICYDVKGKAHTKYRLLTETASSTEVDISMATNRGKEAMLVESVDIRTESMDISVKLNKKSTGELLYTTKQKSGKTDVSITLSEDKRALVIHIGKFMVELAGKHTHILISITDLHYIDGVAGGIMGDVLNSVASIADGQLRLNNGKTLDVQKWRQLVHGNSDLADVVLSCWRIKGSRKLFNIDDYEV